MGRGIYFGGATGQLLAEPNLRNAASVGDWQRNIITTDVDAPDTALTLEHGHAVMRVIGGTGLQSNRRDAWIIPGATTWPNWEITSRWASPPPADGIMEHGHLLNIQLGPDGKYRSVIVWHFIPGLLIAGVWEWNPGGTGLTVFQTSYKDQDTVSASVRASNVVTLTVPTGATSRWRVGDPITVDLADATYDGQSILSAVTDTTLVYPQVAADDASGGTGTVTLLGQTQASDIGRSFLLTDAVRTSGIVTSAGLSLGHSFMNGDWITVDMADATYDGRFIVSGVNAFTGQINWMQFGVANDASAGAGQIRKLTPYNVKSRLLTDGILQVKLWPDIGINGALGFAGCGPVILGEPPWESDFCVSFDINEVAGTIPTGPGLPGLLYAHGSSNSWAVYDNISAVKLVA